MADGGSVTIRAILDHSNVDKGAADVKSNLKGVGDGSFDGVQKGADGAGESIKTLAGRASALGGVMQSVGAAASVGLTLPIVAMGKSAMDTAATFDSAMSQVQGALGDANADMDGLRELALQLGSDTVFSANEAGSAMVELAKGGLTEADIKSGALASSMDLAAAGGLNLANAANSTVQMMGAFKLEAKDTASIANALAGAANASSADVSDLTAAMSQCSAQAHLVGWNIQETAAALGLFADAGVVGSDAGTSLKTMIQSLAAPVDKAADLMSELGLNVRDSSGNMLGVSDIAQELQTKLGGLSAAQRDAALQTIFGSDASRAAAIMMQSGAAGLEKYITATNDATAAEKMAEAQKGDLAWALENMQGSLETASIALGSALAPVIQDIAELIGNLAESFSDLDPEVQKNIALGLAIVAAFGPVAVAFGTVLRAITPLGKGLKAITGVLGGVLTASEAGAGGMLALGTSADKASKGTTGVGTALRGLKGALVASGIGILVALVGELASRFMAYRAKVDLAKDATDGMREAVEASKADYSSAVDGVEGLSASYDDVSQSATDCLQAQADLASQIKTTAEENGTNAALVGSYVGVIDELTGKYDENGNKASLNASEQVKLEAAVAGLNDVCGTTYSIIDATNGVINVSTDELHKNSDAWIKNAKAQAAQEAYKESLKQQIDNERELAKVNEILEKSGGGLAEFFGEIPGLVDGASESYYGLEGKQKDLTEAIAADSDTQDFFLGVMQETSTVIDETAEATAAAAEEATALAAEVKAASDELIAFVGENETFAGMLEASGISVESLAGKMQTAGISVDDLKSGIEEYSSSAQNALGQIEQKSDITLDEMLANLQENARITQEWGDNLKVLYANAGSGAQREFIGYIESLGVEYAPIVAQLVGSSQETMDALVAAYASGGAAGANAYLAQLEGLPPDAANAVAPVGPATNQAVADGINESVDVVYDACGNIISAGTINPGEVNNAPGGESSGTSFAGGQDAAAGTVAASSDAISKLSADHMSSASGDAWWAGYNMAAQSYAQGISGGQGSAVSSAMTASKQVADHLSSSNGDAWWAGYNMTLGMADGIWAGQSAAVNAAASVSAAAVSAARITLDERSPSRVMQGVGEFFTEGMAVGIAKTVALVTDASGFVAASAVDEARSGTDGMFAGLPQVKIAADIVPVISQIPFENTAIDWYAKSGSYNTASIICAGSGTVSPVSSAKQDFRGDSVRAGDVGASGNVTVEVKIENFNNYTSEDLDALVDRVMRDTQRKLDQQRRARGYA